jgi:hypothetical protein
VSAFLIALHFKALLFKRLTDVFFS